MGSVLDAVTQHVDRPALGDLTLQPRQKLSACRTVLAQFERVNDFRLCLLQEGRKVRYIHTAFAVVILWRTADPSHTLCGGPLLDGVDGYARIARRPRQSRADQPLKAALRRVGCHASTSSGVSAAPSVAASSRSVSASPSSMGSGS